MAGFGSAVRQQETPPRGGGGGGKVSEIEGSQRELGRVPVRVGVELILIAGKVNRFLYRAN